MRIKICEDFVQLKEVKFLIGLAGGMLVLLVACTPGSSTYAQRPGEEIVSALTRRWEEIVSVLTRRWVYNTNDAYTTNKNILGKRQT